MKQTMDYQKQATDFMEATNTEFNATFLRHGKHFEDDKETRDIYEILIKRGGREYKFNFGQSFSASGEYQVRKELQNKIWCEQTTGGKICLNAQEFKALKYIGGIERDILKNPNFSAPTPYDVFACLQKNDPSTFENFCADFGYDTDSRKAEKVYQAVREEYLQISRLYTESELEQMQEI